MASDLLSTLKSYLTKVADGEHTPAELASTLNTWIKESTESIKLKVEDEVQRSVSKMGFIKRAEFDALKRELATLRSELAALNSTSTPVSSAARKSSSSNVASKGKAKAGKKVEGVKAAKKVASPKKASAAKKTSAATKAKG